MGAIAAAVGKVLEGSNASRTFATQTLLPMVPLVPAGGSGRGARPLTSTDANEDEGGGFGGGGQPPSAALVAAAKQRSHTHARTEVMPHPASGGDGPLPSTKGGAGAIEARAQAFSAAYAASSSANGTAYGDGSAAAAAVAPDGLDDLFLSGGIGNAAAAATTAGHPHVSFALDADGQSVSLLQSQSRRRGGDGGEGLLIPDNDAGDNGDDADGDLMIVESSSALAGGSAVGAALKRLSSTQSSGGGSSSGGAHTAPGVKLRAVSSSSGGVGAFHSNSSSAKSSQQAAAGSQKAGAAQRGSSQASSAAVIAPNKSIRIDGTHRSLEAYLVPRASQSQAASYFTPSQAGTAAAGPGADGGDDTSVSPSAVFDGYDMDEEGEGEVLEVGAGEDSQHTDDADDGGGGAAATAAEADEDAVDDLNAEGAAVGENSSSSAVGTAAAPASSSHAVPQQLQQQLPRTKAAQPQARRTAPTPVAVNLISVLELRAAIAADAHPGLATMLARCAFVGLVDDTRSLVQHNTRLLLVNHAQCARELFYQRALALFANARRVPCHPPPDVTELLGLALEAYGVGEPGERRAVAEEAAELLASKAAMLVEYFSIGVKSIARRGPTASAPAASTAVAAAAVASVDSEGAVGQKRKVHPMHAVAKAEAATLAAARSFLDGEEEGTGATPAVAAPPPSMLVTLTHLPLLVEGHAPCPLYLPEFLLSLAFDVDWTAEKECFHSVAQTLATYYARMPPLPAEATAVSSVLLGGGGVAQGGGSLASSGGLRDGGGGIESKTVVVSLQAASASAAMAIPAAAAAAASPPAAAPEIDLEALRSNPSAAYWVVERTLLPAFRTLLVPPRKLADGHHVVQVACVEQLYKIFERC